MSDLQNLSPESRALIEDLDLVLVGSSEHLAHLRAISSSHYSCYWFCERVKDLMRSKAFASASLCKSFYDAFRKRSRYFAERKNGEMVLHYKIRF